MAKKDYTYSFKNAYIDVEEDVIVEIGKDFNLEHNLTDVLKELENKQLNITFKESKDVIPTKEEE